MHAKSSTESPMDERADPIVEEEMVVEDEEDDEDEVMV
jgi:hypothetical protein